jgi:hypothetical protein
MVALVTTSGLAAAREGNVFSLTLAESLQYDTNLLRVAPDTNNREDIGSDRRDDFISSTTVALDMSKQIGRHTFYGELSGTDNRFQEFSQLNYIAQNDRLGWSGVFGDDDKWDTYFRHVRSQSDYADFRVPIPNVVTTDTLGGNMWLRLARDWVFRPEVYEDKYSNSASIRQINDNKVRTGTLNLGYRPYTGNVLEAQYRYADRDYDIGGGFWQSETGVFGSWSGGTVSTLEGRIALVRQKAKTGTFTGASDFRQPVGYVNYRWQPTGASLLNFKLFREISTIDIGTDQDAVARGVNAQWTWSPLAKVRFDTIFDYRKRNFPNANAVDPTDPATRIGVKDRTHSVSVGAAYMPTPSWTLQSTIKTETRHAQPSSRGYEDRVYALTLQYSF